MTRWTRIRRRREEPWNGTHEPPARWLRAAVFFLTLSAAAAGEAQTAASFDQLPLLVNLGDRIAVTDRTGRESSGRITELSPGALTLATDDAARVIRAAEVSVIRRYVSDPVGDGWLVGFAVGALIGVVLTVGVDDFDQPGAALAFASWFGSVGAGAGVGVDAMISSRRVIYAPAAPTNSARLTVSPLLTPGRRGVSLSLGF